MSRTDAKALAASDAGSLRFRVVAIKAGHVAILEKDRHAAAGTVDERTGDDAVDGDIHRVVLNQVPSKAGFLPVFWGLPGCFAPDGR